MQVSEHYAGSFPKGGVSLRCLDWIMLTICPKGSSPFFQVQGRKKAFASCT